MKYAFVTRTVTKADDATVSLIFPSGLTGLQQTPDIVTVLTGNLTISITGTTPLTFQYDSRLTGFLTYDIEFNSSLVSGDTLEVYTFPTFNANVGLSIPTDLTFPNVTGFVQLVGNGLVETRVVASA